MEDAEGKETRMLSRLWTKQPSMCGMSATAMRAKSDETAMASGS